MDTIQLFYESISANIPNDCLDKFRQRADKLNADLVFLQPSIPEDNSCGYIAFNVVGKPRMKLRTARFLTRKLSLNSRFLPDDRIQRIAERINLVLFGTALFIELINGPAITETYEKAVGGGSCMTHGSAECTLLYEMNPDRFQMLVMRQFNTSARAIVHKLDNGEYYLDRIYSNSQTLVLAMREYAQKHNWNYRDEHGCPSCSGNILVVSDLNWEDGHVPYMDTMIYGEITDSGKLSISAQNGNLDLQNINGYIESESCEHCGIGVDRDDVFSGPNGEDCYCESCYYELFTSCDRCGETVYNDDTVYLESEDHRYCTSCADGCAWCCDKCNNYFSNHENSTPARNVGDVCERCLKEYAFCDCCNEYHEEASFETVNGENICQTCANSDYKLCATCRLYFEEAKCPNCGKE